MRQRSSGSRNSLSAAQCAARAWPEQAQPTQESEEALTAGITQAVIIFTLPAVLQQGTMQVDTRST